jgi:hypothetical protein
MKEAEATDGHRSTQISLKNAFHGSVISFFFAIPSDLCPSGLICGFNCFSKVVQHTQGPTAQLLRSPEQHLRAQMGCFFEINRVVGWKSTTCDVGPSIAYVLPTSKKIGPQLCVSERKVNLNSVGRTL